MALDAERFAAEAGSFLFTHSSRYGSAQLWRLTLMTHQEKLAEMYRHMAMLGVRKSTAAPPAWRLLWHFGIEVPPPLFTSFLPGALAMGAFFGVFWGLLMWAILWARQGMPLYFVAVLALAAGALFGLTMAAYFRHLSRKHRLPRWAEYTGAPERA